MTNIQWQPISYLLKKVYQEQNIIEYFKKDESYLKNAFEVTETLWTEQFNRLDKLKVIMISESPLFGNIQKYIYNINTPPSSFFYFQDIEAFPNCENIIQPTTIEEQKKIMLNEFKKNGFLILDIFPFALNQKDTIINYGQMNIHLYRQLLKITTETYLIPKLKLCLEKSNQHTHFIYRYQRLFNRTENHFENVLNQISPERYKIDTINGRNMSLDRDELKRLLKN